MRKRHVFIAAVLLLLIPLAAAPLQVTPAANHPALPETNRERLLGTVWIAYAPTNFNPDAHPPVLPSAESIREDLATLRNAGFDGLVTYGSDIVAIPAIAESVGFRAMLVGVWAPGDAQEMRLAKQAARSSLVAGVIVGNEGLTFHRYSLAVLREAMEEIRRDTGKPVSTTEVIESYFTKSELGQWSDFLAVNAHPYFHEIHDPVAAAEWTAKAYSNLAKRFPDKVLLFKEVGLPTAAEGLTEQAQFDYYEELRRTPVHFVFFEAFDALFKQGRAEQSWGIFHADRTPKPAASLAKAAGESGRLKVDGRL